MSEQCMNCRWAEPKSLFATHRDVVQEGVQLWTRCHVRLRAEDVRYLRDEVQREILNNADRLDGGHGVAVRCDHSCELWAPIPESGLRGRGAQVEALRHSGLVSRYGKQQLTRHLNNWWAYFGDIVDSGVFEVGPTVETGGMV